MACILPPPIFTFIHNQVIFKVMNLNTMTMSSLEQKSCLQLKEVLSYLPPKPLTGKWAKYAAVPLRKVKTVSIVSKTASIRRVSGQLQWTMHPRTAEWELYFFSVFGGNDKLLLVAFSGYQLLSTCSWQYWFNIWCTIKTTRAVKHLNC